jgi:ABC-2 type transport system ATP-binding protein
MRLELCAAFLYNPEIVFLDEPTIGLDIFAKESILNFIKEVRDENSTTIILTTHDVSDIEKLCNRLIIFDKGRILFDGETKSIASAINVGLNILATIQEKEPILTNLVSKYQIVKTEHSIKILNVEKDEIPELIYSILKNNDVKELAIESPDFKEVLKRFYEEN